MISEPLAKLLVAQISSELGAHQTYLGISLYFERQSLRRWAKVFRDQSAEEAQHASKIMAFLLDNEVEFELPGLPGATTHYKSATDAVGVALASEARRSRASTSPASSPKPSGTSSPRMNPSPRQAPPSP